MNVTRSYRISKENVISLQLVILKKTEVTRKPKFNDKSYLLPKV